MKQHSFVKEFGGWYIDLPEYLEGGGSKADLAMVAGADTLLDLIAEGKESVTLSMDTKPFKGSDELILLRLCDSSTGGGDYFMKTYAGQPINQELWLCDVTLFVFGDMPEKIFIRKED